MKFSVRALFRFGATVLIASTLGNSLAAANEITLKATGKKKAGSSTATDFHIEFQSTGGAHQISGTSTMSPFTGVQTAPSGQVSAGETRTIDFSGGGSVAAGESATYNIVLFGSLTGVKITKREWTPTTTTSQMVGFSVEVGTNGFSLTNDFSDILEVTGLSFHMSSTPLDLDLLEPGAAPGFSIPVADFLISGNSALSFSLPGTLTDDVFLYAQGTVSDSDFTEATGSFLYSFTAIPEPNTALLLSIGLIGLGARRRLG